jgi:hypothetical protein
VSVYNLLTCWGKRRNQPLSSVRYKHCKTDTTFAMFCTRFIHTVATLYSAAQITALRIGSLQIKRVTIFKWSMILHCTKAENRCVRKIRIKIIYVLNVSSGIWKSSCFLNWHAAQIHCFLYDHCAYLPKRFITDRSRRQTGSPVTSGRVKQNKFRLSIKKKE